MADYEADGTPIGDIPTMGEYETVCALDAAGGRTTLSGGLWYYDGTEWVLTQTQGL